MRLIRRGLAWLLVPVLVVAGGLWAFGPREPAPLDAVFDAAALGDDFDAYLAREEGAWPDIVPGTEKRVVWAGEPGVATSLALVYIHGFSASSEEIRPLPDRLAEALRANLVYTRLQGHARGGPALGTATVQGWMTDTAEAIAVARAVGDEVIVIATSTGATLAAVAATRPDLAQGVKGVILVSPNFGVNNPAAPLLTWPAARHWLPLLAGRERGFEPRNERQAEFWTTRYPAAALFPMAALVRAAVGLDYSEVRVPALFWFSDNDRVVRPAMTRKIAARWGGPVTLAPQVMGKDDDTYAHVIAGDILSPGQTMNAVAGMLAWIKGL